MQAKKAIEIQAQDHLLPKMLDQKVGSTNNELDLPKRKYIINMRKGLAGDNSKHIIFEDGSLNFKYFNVKKGHYWSKEENERLLEGVLKFGACAFQDIKDKCFHKENWSVTEIRLRICRLLKCYDLSPYETRKFNDAEEVMAEAKRNKEEAIRLKKVCGGILYNPPACEKADEGIITSLFNKSK